MGRPTVLTDETQGEMCRLVASGKFVAVACGLVGISEDVVALWLRRADAHDAGEEVQGLPTGERCSDFARAFRKAKAEGLDYHLSAIERMCEATDRSQNPADWKGHAWFAERLAPRLCGPAAQKLELAGAEGGPIQVVGTEAKSAVLNAIWGAPDAAAADTEPPPKP